MDIGEHRISTKEQVYAPELWAQLIIVIQQSRIEIWINGIVRGSGVLRDSVMYSVPSRELHFGSHRGLAFFMEGYIHSITYYNGLDLETSASTDLSAVPWIGNHYYDPAIFSAAALCPWD
jgi:hypothetical protein